MKIRGKWNVKTLRIVSIGQNKVRLKNCKIYRLILNKQMKNRIVLVNLIFNYYKLMEIEF